jgi:spermidine synthase
LSTQEVDRRVEQRIAKGLKFYDGETHHGMFALPKFLREGIQQEQRLNRDSSPVFMV